MSNQKTVAVIMRSKNEQPYTGPALRALFAQTFQDFKLYNVDSGSTDGTLGVVQKFNEDVVMIGAQDYVPGTVLNEMISQTNEEIIVFLNADAIPQDKFWLQHLVEPILKGDCDASLSRQVSRTDAHFIVQYDYERAYKKVIRENSHEMFSAVSCAFKKEMWNNIKFYTEGYAEDLVWSTQCYRSGYRFRYVAESVVEHSHNYELKHLFKKKFRHGLVYFRLLGQKPSFFKQSYLWLREICRDLLKACKRKEWLTIPYNLAYRSIIHAAIYRGEKRASSKKEAQL
jgi:rhamnosyltransferase